MKRSTSSKSPPAAQSLALRDFQTPAEDQQGLSLEELSTAYAELLQRGNTPYDETIPAESAPNADLGNEAVASSADESAQLPDEMSVADVGCELSPRSILEAMLFVGNSQSQPL